MCAPGDDSLFMSLLYSHCAQKYRHKHTFKHKLKHKHKHLSVIVFPISVFAVAVAVVVTVFIVVAFIYSFICSFVLLELPCSSLSQLPVCQRMHAIFHSCFIVLSVGIMLLADNQNLVKCVPSESSARQCVRPYIFDI